jgi:hypothetical protein
MKVQKFKNDGGLQTVYTEPSEIADFVKFNIESILDYWIKKSQRLEEENRLLKDNEFVQKVIEENEELKEKLSKSFQFNSNMRKEATKWHDEHFTKLHPTEKKWQIHYEFHPTYLDTMGYIVCDICNEKYYLGGF